MAVWAAFGAAVVAGCGGAGGQAYSGSTDSGAGADTGGSGSSSGGFEAGSSGSSGSGSGSSGDDASAPIDASLDIAFPDSFYGPEVSTPEGGEDATEEGGCSPAGVTCQGSVAYDCSGGVLTTTDCSQQATDKTCADGFGCVQCVPGTGSCNGNTGTACNATGTGTVTNVCDPLQGEACTAGTGQCSGACADLGASYIGCEYYAVTMLNQLLDQSTFYYAVSISNTGSSTATVNIQGARSPPR